MSTTKTSAQVPKLRFPGFEGEWKDIAMGELLSFKNGYNADKEQYGTGVKFINVLDIIQNDYITHDRIIGSVTMPEKDFEKNEVRYGDLLFQRSSETREEVGQANVYLDKDTPATFGGFVIRGRPLKEFDSVYFNALLKTAKVRKDMTSRSGGATRYNIGQDSLEEVTVNLSPFLPEQQKIAAFLTAVDGRIEQLSRKKALLEAYKKGVMQQLFTQTLRFQDDHGHDFPDWEEKTLGELYDITSSKRVFQSEWQSEGVPFYRAREIIKLGSEGHVDNELFISEQMFAEYSQKYGAPREDDLLVTGVGTIGKVYRVPKGSRFYFKDGNIVWLRNQKRVLSSFVEHLFKSDVIQKQLLEQCAITTVATYTIVAAKQTRIPFPCIEEQTKIAGFLSALEGKIAAVGEQMRQTQAWKKGLLQQMFV